MRPEQLHVIAVMSNPVRYQSRIRLFQEFVERTKHAGVTLWLGEAVFGEREFEVSKIEGAECIQFRCDQEIWLKEALINAVARFLPLDARYIMWLDADVTFVKSDWAVETLQQLQNYKVVQAFQHAIDLGPDQEMIQNHQGFAFRHCAFRQVPVPNYGTHMHPGYAWAWRRDAWDSVGGMLDMAICGAGDHHMACGLVGHAGLSVPGGLHSNYLADVLAWQERAKESVNGHLGFVPGTILHHFHGWKADRKYIDRWDILKSNNFDPHVDITRDSQGMLRLRGNKPRLRDDLQRYFRQRNEDAR